MGLAARQLGTSGPAGASTSREASDRAAFREEDARLVAQATGGDRLAFRVLYERSSAAAYRMAFRLVRRADMAEEIVQEAYCQAWAGMRTFKGQSQFGTWVLSIARHVALDVLRRQKSRRTHPAADTLDERPGRAEQADARVRGKELHQALEAALAELPEESRTAFTLAALERLPYADVAAVIGSTTDGVKCRVFRAREFLRARLQRFEDVE